MVDPQSDRMQQLPVRLGIVGLGARAGWAMDAHIPAIRAIPELTIQALAASTDESARLAGETYGVPHVFSRAEDLAKCQDVDLVVVTVRVDRHEPAVAAAIAAGKQVLCEWPLGKTFDEARRLESLARDAGVRTFIGLQGRSSPVVRYVADLVAEGYVGRVLSSSMIASSGGWGATFEDRSEYYLDSDSGGTLISITAAHTLDAICQVLGTFSELSAHTAVRRPTVTALSDGRTRPKTAPDQLVVTGTVDEGVVLNAHFRGGTSGVSHFHWEINGTEGDLLVTGDRPNFWIAKTSILGANKEQPQLHPLPLPEKYESRVPAFAGRDGEAAHNVAYAYATVIDDLKHGTQQAPTFGDALELHNLVDRIERAAATGQLT